MSLSFRCFMVAFVVSSPVTAAQDMNGVVVRPSDAWLSMIGVCPLRSGGKSWSVVWHQQVPNLPAEEQARIFRDFENPEVNACLELFLVSDPETAALLARIDLESSSNELPKLVNRAVRARWIAVGVDKALEEVALTGGSGRAVGAMIASCRNLREKRERQEKSRTTKEEMR